MRKNLIQYYYMIFTKLLISEIVFYFLLKRQLSLHHPDLAIGVISAAGWLKKEDYGDSNLFYRHDISISHTDPAVKVIQEACIAENDADKHASNLKVCQPKAKLMFPLKM